MRINLWSREGMLGIIILLLFAAYIILNPPPSNEALQSNTAVIMDLFQATNHTSSLDCNSFLFGNEGDLTYNYSIRVLNHSNIIGFSNSILTIETVNGTPRPVRDVSYSFISTINRQSITTKVRVGTHIDPVSMGCVFHTFDVQTSDNTTSSTQPCSPNDLYGNYSAYRLCETDLRYLRTEQVRVPTGTFTAKVYEDTASGVTYWDAGLPFPIRIESAKSISELSGYGSAVVTNPLQNISSPSNNTNTSPANVFLSLPVQTCNRFLTAGSERYSFTSLTRMEDTQAASLATITINSTLMRNRGQFGQSNATYIRITEYSQNVTQPTTSTNITQQPLPTARAFSRTRLVFYLDNDLKCMGEQGLVVSSNGTSTNQVFACDANAVNSFNVCGDNLTEDGSETITVGAGTFNVKNYVAADNSTVSVSDRIPLLIRTTGPAYTELLSYEKVA